MKQLKNLSNIQIKFIFSDWKEVTKEQAKKFVESLLNSGMTCPAIKKCEHSDTATPKLYKYIESNYLKGITVEKLLKEQ